MQLTVLGAGTAIPMIERSPSGYLLRAGDQSAVLDMGPGTLGRLLKAGLSHKDITSVFISHLHSDHVLDVVTLLQACEPQRKQPLSFVGCRGLKDFIDQLIVLFDVAPTGFELKISELGAERRQLQGWIVETALTGHTENSLAFRFEAEGAKLTYSGDAVESAELAQLARDADLFVCECSYPRGFKTTDHVTADGAGRMAAKANARRLLLTHLYPAATRVDVSAQAGEFYEKEIIVATDGTFVEF
jgi:ribonuclease BN (tRNA processing enzyme)